MKKLLICVAASAFALSGCFEAGNIAAVKDGVMDFDKSLKVGDAFGNWGECTEKNWSEFKTTNGRKVVQFECKSTKVHDFVKYGKAHFPDLFPADFKDLDATVTTFQWTINTDDTFELTSATRLYKWADGAVSDGSGGAPAERRVQVVYSNEVEFDVASLQAPSGRNVASAQSMNLGMIRRFAPKVSPPNVSAAEPPAPQPTALTADQTVASGPENYAETWAGIQRDPNVYLAKCMRELKADFIAHGTTIAAPALEEETRKDCTAKINDIKQCMGKPNAKVDVCFDTANITGDY